MQFNIATQNFQCRGIKVINRYHLYIFIYVTTIFSCYGRDDNIPDARTVFAIRAKFDWNPIKSLTPSPGVLMGTRSSQRYTAFCRDGYHWMSPNSYLLAWSMNSSSMPSSLVKLNLMLRLKAGSNENVTYQMYFL